jgi:long-chain fatty acid transport protein
MSGAAVANPFYVGRYRGLQGGPLDDSGWSVYWNPAQIGAQPGGRFALSLQSIQRHATYDKPANLNNIPADEAAANAGFNETNAFGIVPAMAGGWSWHTGDLDIGLGGTLFVARAGSSHWEKKPGAPAEFPGAYDGPQRWSTVNTSMVIVSTGVGLGIAHRPTGLSVGVTPVLNLVRLSTARARNLDSSETLFQPDGRLKEGRILFEDGEASALTWIAGLRWDASDMFSAAATIHTGTTYDLTGTAYIQAGDEPEQSAAARFPLQVAHTVRGSVAIKLVPWLVLRPEFEWSNWSVMDRQPATNDNPDDPGYGDELIPIERQFKDTLAARLRLDLPLIDNTTFHLGGGWEQGATPTRTFEPGLAESDSIEAGAGVSAVLPWGVSLAVHYILQQFDDVTVTDSVQKPTTNGTYTDRRHYVTVDLEFAFGGAEDAP